MQSPGVPLNNYPPYPQNQTPLFFERNEAYTLVPFGLSSYEILQVIKHIPMYQTIEDVLKSPVSLSTYRGSTKTKDMVAEQIKAKYGAGELRNFNPYTSMMTFSSWLKLGFKPKKGEKAITSVTYIEVKDENGRVTRKQKRSVNLFYYRQVMKI